MEEKDPELLWSKPGSEELDDFYASAFSATVKNLARFKIEGQTEAAVARIFQSVSNIVKVYGVEADEESIVIKYFSPDNGYGVWTFDVRFSVKGKSSQVMSAAMTLAEAANGVSSELKEIINGIEIERS
jgi:hypothetical protein